MENNVEKREEITTWAAKVPMELKNKISEIIKDENLNSKDFLFNLIDLYEIDKLKKNSGMEKDLEDLQLSLNRVLGIFKSCLERNNSIENNIEDKYINVVKQKEEEITSLSEQLEKVKKEKEEVLAKNEETKRERDDLKTSIKSVQKEVEEKNEYLAALKEKADYYSKISVQNEEYKNEIENLKSDLDEVKSELKDSGLREAELAREIETLKNQKEVEITQLKMSFNNELSELKDKHNSSLLQAQDKYSAEMRSKMDEFYEMKDMYLGLKVENEILKSKVDVVTKDSIGDTIK